MKVHDVSQIPVLENNKVLGIVDESDVLLATYKNKESFRKPVKEIMETKLEVLSPKDSPDKVLPLFKRGMVAIVADDHGFHGIITKMDFLNYLRRSM